MVLLQTVVLQNSFIYPLEPETTPLCKSVTQAVKSGTVNMTFLYVGYTQYMYLLLCVYIMYHINSIMIIPSIFVIII